MTHTDQTLLEKVSNVGNIALVRALKFAIGLMPIRDPKLLVGPDSVKSLVEVIAESGLKRILIVTTSGIVKRGQLDEIIHHLNAHNIYTSIYAKVTPDPTVSVANDGLHQLRSELCDGVLAFGGGSTMDVAKVIALAASNTTSAEKLIGYFKGRKKPLPLFAIPTTAGTGSEVTIASVISDDHSHEKGFVIDYRTIPLAAALNPVLMKDLPQQLTATTGMDALTHAIEAYISTIHTNETDAYAQEAIKLIFIHLPTACHNGTDLTAREAMSLASYKAGQAFTRASLGYVHAISHQLGAKYGIAHGLGNAIVLPAILEFSLPAIKVRLAQLALTIGAGKPDEPTDELAIKFIEQVRQLNKHILIPETIADLRPEDIPILAKKALQEATWNYPVPRHMGLGQCQALLESLLPEA